MKRKWPVYVAGLTATGLMLAWLQQSAIHCRLFPSDCLSGVWEVENREDPRESIVSALYTRVDFDERDSLLVGSDGVCVSPTHQYRVVDDEIWIVPWEGVPGRIDASSHPRRFRYRFESSDRLLVWSEDATGATTLVRNEDIEHLYPEPMGD